MSNSSAAILVGRHERLSREIWAGFVQSGLVELVLTFRSVDDLLENTHTESKSIDVDIKLMFFLIESMDDLGTPIDLKVHHQLSRVPLIAFYTPETELTRTDIQTLYDRRVSSVVRLPLRFQDLGHLVLQMDRYWAVGKLPQCELSLPTEYVFTPKD
ncbi:hypothetical protein [Marinobacter sp. CHS3-4]|uniref:hypothetical protein n=1 Tax=Marinobacter sp. CHS3-4 TaxID=3045174 RepID=UPI0024B5A1C0|nr:hypothetical protein [Marinobacter sp. CHS3-4]MDI9245617.1 hypothetical protein [Marinobacter sp. CHS3-4]